MSLDLTEYYEQYGWESRLTADAAMDELEESARLDGASTFRIFWRICLPLARPAVAALFVLDFVATWNENAMATTLLQSRANWTVPLAVQGFSSQHGTDYGPSTPSSSCRRSRC